MVGAFRGAHSSGVHAQSQIDACCTAVEMGLCVKYHTRSRQAGLTSFRVSARIIERRALREEEPRARPSSFRCFVVSSRTRLFFTEGASLHDSGGPAEGRKSCLPCSCAGLRTVAHLNGRAKWHPSCSSCRRACVPDELAPRNGPTKTRFQGWRCYKTTLAAIKARSCSALIFRGE